MEAAKLSWLGLLTCSYWLISIHHPNLNTETRACYPIPCWRRLQSEMLSDHAWERGGDTLMDSGLNSVSSSRGANTGDLYTGFICHDHACTQSDSDMQVVFDDILLWCNLEEMPTTSTFSLLKSYLARHYTSYLLTRQTSQPIVKHHQTLSNIT